MADQSSQGSSRNPKHGRDSVLPRAGADLEQPVPESVSTLLSIVQRMFDDELQRGRDLDTKMATLAGFSGTILALTAAIANNLLKVHVASLAEIGIRTLFVTAILALAAAAVLAVAGALLPRQRLQVDTSVISDFASFPLFAASKLEIEGQLLSTLVEQLEFERLRNGKKALFGRAAGAVLIAGFVAVASLALTRLFVTT